ncbi:MAG: nitroreductase family deazaflavin-dependent oxidoreductase [Actinomycetota bacterium]
MPNWNRQVIEEFRANGGRVQAFARQPLLLLTHRGAKTGTERTNPVAYFPDGDRYVIVASKGGAPTNPDWYFNLKANPDASVELGTESFDVHATEVTPEDRSRLWSLVTSSNPAFAEYETKTERTIPLFVLERTPA